ncbi:hypothetical protein [Thermoactinospora rubra]|uniref:hypothetical protein n=1 Tax=Thermoactinospora rubra TaxID=1088767 RepID=UPI000A11D663|nr:hypothetical protein [Thermoactinospora rubra]
MQKITIGDESVELDIAHLPLHEGIALQRATGWRIKELGEACAAGDLVAIAALAWLALRRMGKDVTFADIESGAYPIDLASINVEVLDEPSPPSGGEAKTSPPNA